MLNIPLEPFNRNIHILNYTKNKLTKNNTYIKLKIEKKRKTLRLNPKEKFKKSYNQTFKLLDI